MIMNRLGVTVTEVACGHLWSSTYLVGLFSDWRSYGSKVCMFLSTKTKSVSLLDSAPHD